MEVFNRLHQKRQEYQEIMYRIEEEETIGTKCTQTFTSEPQGSGGPSDKVGNSACRIVELRGKLKVKIAEVREALEEAQELLDRMEGQEKQVISLRYLQGKKWREIANILGVTEDQAFNIRRRAIKKYGKSIR